MRERLDISGIGQRTAPAWPLGKAIGLPSHPNLMEDIFFSLCLASDDLLKPWQVWNSSDAKEKPNELSLLRAGIWRYTSPKDHMQMILH